MKPVPLGFDAIASRYDELWTNTETGQSQRAQVWAHIDSLWKAGERILDIGCGTGVDALHLASRGVAVDAIDASPAMVASCAVPASVLRAEEIGTLPGTYDGALSNFGALNCVADLRPVVAGLSARVRPGGRVAICMIGRFCMRETLRFAVRLQFRKAVRRWPGQAQASIGITVYYPTVRQLRRLFAPQFVLQRSAAIGMGDHRLLIFTRK